MATEELKDEDYEETEIEPLHFVNQRSVQSARSENSSEYEYDDDSSITKMVNSRSFRLGLVTTILLIWSALMIPYDIEGKQVDDIEDSDLTMFSISLYMWLISHLCCIIAASLCLFIITFMRNGSHDHDQNESLLDSINASCPLITCFLLLMLASTLQIIGAILYAYSYCQSVDDDSTSDLWASCISKSHGLYLLYNSGLITYLGLVVYADAFDGSIPLISLFCDKRLFVDTDDGNLVVKFSKNFRICYLSIITTIGMSLILVYGFNIYDTVGESYQAIYIGYIFMLFATSLVIIKQFLFHCRLFDKCNKTKEKIIRPKNDIRNRPNTRIRNYKIQKSKMGQRIESAMNLIIHFSIYAAIVLIAMYSMVSKIPEAGLVIERLRLVGNMICITGSGIVISYELYTKKDDYDNNQQNQYNIIPDPN